MGKHIAESKIIDHFHRQLSMIRTGVVNSSILDHVTVTMYGSKMKIIELATINKPEPSQLIITPYDKGAIAAISRAIQESNIGVNPVDDGAGVRLVFPPMTQENRKSRLKEVSIELENAKISVRNIRHDVLKSLKVAKEAAEISEDELKTAENEIQKEVDVINTQLESIAKAKEEDLMKM